MQRDLEFMRDRLNLPVEFDSAHNGYRYTEEGEVLSHAADHRGANCLPCWWRKRRFNSIAARPSEARLVGALRKLEQALPDAVSLNLAQ